MIQVVDIKSFSLGTYVGICSICREDIGNLPQVIFLRDNEENLEIHLPVHEKCLDIFMYKYMIVEMVHSEIELSKTCL